MRFSVHTGERYDVGLFLRWNGDEHSNRNNSVSGSSGDFPLKGLLVATYVESVRRRSAINYVVSNGAAGDKVREQINGDPGEEPNVGVLESKLGPHEPQQVAVRAPGGGYPRTLGASTLS
jgi:hypothetical protein